MVKRARRWGYLKSETYWPNPKGVISEPEVVTAVPTPLVDTQYLYEHVCEHQPIVRYSESSIGKSKVWI